MTFKVRPDLMRTAAILWLLVAAVGLVLHFRLETVQGLTSGGTTAFGDDFISFWAAPRLALLGHAAEAYDFGRFHQFQMEVLGGTIHLYHYTYPPVMTVLVFPFALFPYLPGLAVWIVGGAAAWLATVRAAWPRAEPRWRDVCLYALAVPALFINTLTGQVGAWMAALGGAGLMVLGRRPVLGGALLGLLTAKPQLALLVPVALLFGRNWAALASFVATSALLMLATFVLFGLDAWLGFLTQLSVVRAVILEDGTGNWHLFASVFVMLRHLPASLFVSYVAQIFSATVALVLVVHAWRSEASQLHKNAVLVMAVCFTTPYILVYDLVITALVPLWLFSDATAANEWRPFRLAALALLVLAPFLIPIIALRVGFEAGPLLLAPALVVAVQACLESAQRHRARARMAPV